MEQDKMFTAWHPIKKKILDIQDGGKIGPIMKKHLNRTDSETIQVIELAESSNSCNYILSDLGDGIKFKSNKKRFKIGSSTSETATQKLTINKTAEGKSGLVTDDTTTKTIQNERHTPRKK